MVCILHNAKPKKPQNKQTKKTNTPRYKKVCEVHHLDRFSKLRIKAYTDGEFIQTCTKKQGTMQRNDMYLLQL